MKIKPTQISKITPRISPTILRLKQYITFSFKYLKEDRKFKYTEKEKEYFCRIIDRLKWLSGEKPTIIQGCYNKTLRNHQINWKAVSENCFGIPNEDDIANQAYQFSLSKNNGRVHGFFIGTVFHIVWFDPKHALHP